MRHIADTKHEHYGAQLITFLIDLNFGTNAQNMGQPY